MTRLTSDADRIVGVLHDVVEDTKDKPKPITLDELRRMGYSEEIIRAVDCLSRRDGETYDAFILRAKANPVARRVKLVDLEDNMDIRRLSENLTPNDWERLARYRKAWAILTEHGS